MHALYIVQPGRLLESYLAEAGGSEAKASSSHSYFLLSAVPSPGLFAEVLAREEGEGEESGLQAPPCCAGVECRERANEGCRKKLACGHPCRGPGEETQQLEDD